MIPTKTHCSFCGSILTREKIEGRLRKVCGTCHEIAYENPVPAVCMVVTNKKTELLLVKRNQEPGIGLWCLPGGFMELGETPVETGIRELMEETGLKGKAKQLIGVDSDFHDSYNTVTLTCFHCENFYGEITPGDDADDACFFSKENLPEIAFDTHIRFIRMFFAGYA